MYKNNEVVEEIYIDQVSKISFLIFRKQMKY